MKINIHTVENCNNFFLAFITKKKLKNVIRFIKQLTLNIPSLKSIETRGLSNILFDQPKYFFYVVSNNQKLRANVESSRHNKHNKNVTQLMMFIHFLHDAGNKICVYECLVAFQLLAQLSIQHKQHIIRKTDVTTFDFDFEFLLQRHSYK